MATGRRPPPRIRRKRRELLGVHPLESLPNVLIEVVGFRLGVQDDLPSRPADQRLVFAGPAAVAVAVEVQQRHAHRVGPLAPWRVDEGAVPG